jgi:CRP/FNR family transcriptional regulator, cyclic AMP receptor protein
MQAIRGCDSKGLLTLLAKRYGAITMPTIVQSFGKRENTGRTLNAPGMFAELPPEIQQQLTNSAHIKKYADGQLIQHRGDDPTSFFVIATGQVKMGQYGKNGDMRTLMILEAGDSFGEMSCLGRFPRALDGEAVGETELLQISEKKLSEILLTSPILCREVMRVLSVYLQEAMEHIVIYRKLPAPKQLVRSLLALTKGKPAPIMLNIRHQELAELVGVSRVSVAKTLSLLGKKGYLECGYGQIIIHDPEALRTWAEM